MTVIRVKGFQIFRDRHGRLRCYHRRTHTAIDLNKAPIGSAEFFARIYFCEIYSKTKHHATTFVCDGELWCCFDGRWSSMEWR